MQAGVGGAFGSVDFGRVEHKVNFHGFGAGRMRTLVRPGRLGVLVRVEERGTTAFLLAGVDDAAQVYFDPAEALASFQDVERGAAPRPRSDRKPPLLGRLRRQFA